MNKEQFEYEMQVQQKVKQGLEKLFKKNKLSQAEFANLFDFSQKSVSNWLNCKTSMKLNSMIKICDFYNLKIAYFLGA